LDFEKCIKTLKIQLFSILDNSNKYKQVKFASKTCKQNLQANIANKTCKQHLQAKFASKTCEQNFKTKP